MLPVWSRQPKSTEMRERAMLWTLSPGAVFSSASPRAFALTGWVPSEYVGKPFHAYLHPSDLERATAAFAEVLEGESVSLDAISVLATDGTYRRLDVLFVPVVCHSVTTEVLVVGLGQEPVEVLETPLPSNVFVLPDQYDRRTDIPSQLGALGALLESFLANAPVGFAVLDTELHFVCFNQTFASLTGYSPAQAMGLSFETLAPEITPLLREILKSDLPSRDQEVVFRKRVSQEDERCAVVSCYPIPDGRGVTCGIATIAVDVTARKQAEEKLQRVSQALQRSNEALDSFCSIASHDLNEPLRTVASFVRLLEKKYEGHLDAAGKEYVRYALEGTQRMRQLIDGILEYSRNGAAKQTVTDVNCNELVQTTRSNLRVALEECGGEVTCARLPVVTADRTLVLQTLQNLVANSLKYRSEKRCQVHVSVEREPGHWKFSVRDNGIGIAPEYLSDVFAPFRRLHSQEEYSGVGLGLAICSKNVERLGGRIWATSGVGGGSTFSFTIPFVRRGSDH